MTSFSCPLLFLLQNWRIGLPHSATRGSGSQFEFYARDYLLNRPNRATGTSILHCLYGLLPPHHSSAS